MTRKPHTTRTPKTMTEVDMISALRDLPMGAPLVLIYTKGGKDTAASTASRAQSDAMGLLHNIYIGTFAGMVEGAGKKVCARMVCANRGGELRTFNPSVGTLHAVMPGAAFAAAFGVFGSLANTLPAEALAA